MSFLDKAKEALRKHSDKVNQGIEKAGDFADQKTGGKYADQVDKAQAAARERLGEGEPRGGEPGGPDQPGTNPLGTEPRGAGQPDASPRGTEPRGPEQPGTNPS